MKSQRPFQDSEAERAEFPFVPSFGLLRLKLSSLPAAGAPRSRPFAETFPRVGFLGFGGMRYYVIINVNAMQ